VVKDRSAPRTDVSRIKVAMRKYKNGDVGVYDGNRAMDGVGRYLRRGGTHAAASSTASPRLLELK